jgi:hypothetical protein
MRTPISAGSGLVLAMLALGSTPATACGWGGCGCGGYGYAAYGYADYGYGASGYGAYGYGAANYYGAPAYAYDAPQVYAPPAYGYAPPAYYAPPPAYYAPPVYYAGPTVASYRPPGSYAPPGYYARPSFGVPYSQPYSGRRGYVATFDPRRPRGFVPAPFPGRGSYPFAAQQGPRIVKPPMPSYKAPGQSASAANIRGNNVGPVHYNGRPNYIPAAYYGGSGGSAGWRR